MRDVLPKDEGGIEGGIEEGFDGAVDGEAFFEGGRGHGACGWGGREGRRGMRSLFVPRKCFLLLLLAKLIRDFSKQRFS